MDPRPVQIERMRPEQLNAACKQFPVAYIPVGAMEFHGYHLPVGLDGLKAHGLLKKVAEKFGGLVAPAIFHGNGGEHAPFEWTWMIDRYTLSSLIKSVMLGLEKSGIKVIVILSGHYPNHDLMPELIAEYQKEGGKCKVIALKEHEAWSPDEEMRGDHAAKWEGSFLMALEPDTVDYQKTKVGANGKTPADFPPVKPVVEGGWWFEKNKEHPWFGVATCMGSDPSQASKELGEDAIKTFVDYLGNRVTETLSKITP